MSQRRLFVRKSIQRGFSLMELAVVLMIIGTLMSGVLVAVSQTTANARITSARAQLREVEDALYGYAQANGRLPCPATDDSGGFADPIGDGICTEQHGFVPVSTLGLYGAVNADGLLLDPWQNPLRYSVSRQVCIPGCSATDPSFTSTAGLAQVFSNGAVETALMLRVCTAATCNADEVISNIVPAVVYSMGANWADYDSADEIQNSGNGSTTLGSYNVKNNTDDDFVAATYSEENFDDQLLWLSPYVLFNRLVSAGKLP